MDLPTEPGTDAGENTACGHSWDEIFGADDALAPAEQGCGQRAGEKEQQIDGPGLCVRCLMHNGQPEHQQAAATDAKACQDPKSGADDY